jgi:hypothetical protein
MQFFLLHIMLVFFSTVLFEKKVHFQDAWKQRFLHLVRFVDNINMVHFVYICFIFLGSTL